MATRAVGATAGEGERAEPGCSCVLPCSVTVRQTCVANPVIAASTLHGSAFLWPCGSSGVCSRPSRRPVLELYTVNPVVDAACVHSMGVSAGVLQQRGVKRHLPGVAPGSAGAERLHGCLASDSRRRSFVANVTKPVGSPAVVRRAKMASKAAQQRLRATVVQDGPFATRRTSKAAAVQPLQGALLLQPMPLRWSGFVSQPHAGQSVLSPVGFSLHRHPI